MTYTVGYMIGSLSAVSINRILARALVRLAPPEWNMVEIPIKDLPLYNRDLDSDYPSEARALKDAIAGVDAVLFRPPSTTGTSRAASRTPSTGQAGHGERIRLPASRRPLLAPRPARSAPPSPNRTCAASLASAPRHR